MAGRATLATGSALDMVCFHAQQAVEKSLKALLAVKDVQYPWRHDLGELLNLVEINFPDLQLPCESILELAPYAVEARYDHGWSPEPDEANRAMALADSVFTMVEAFINPG